MTSLERDIECRQELTIRECIRINDDNSIKSDLCISCFSNTPSNGCPFSRLPFKPLQTLDILTSRNSTCPISTSIGNYDDSVPIPGEVNVMQALQRTCDSYFLIMRRD